MLSGWLLGTLQHAPLLEDPGIDPEHAGEIKYLICPGNVSSGAFRDHPGGAVETDIGTTLMNLLPPELNYR